MKSLRSYTQLPKRERLKIRDAPSRKDTFLQGTNLAEDNVASPVVTTLLGRVAYRFISGQYMSGLPGLLAGPLVTVCCFSPAAAIRLSDLQHLFLAPGGELY